MDVALEGLLWRHSHECNTQTTATALKHNINGAIVTSRRIVSRFEAQP